MLTEKRVRDAMPEEKTRILWDGTVKGLGVRITPAGVKAYILNYRDAAGKSRRSTIARTEAVSLREARTRAGRELAAIRAGEADPIERQREARQAPTFADGVERYFSVYAPGRVKLGRLKDRTVREYRHQVNGYLLDTLGPRPVTEIVRRDIELLVDPMPGVTRNRVLAFLSMLFNRFEDWEWRPQHTNPARRLERFKEDPRNRVLSPPELAALSGALKGLAKRFPASVAAIRFAAVTGLRIGEVLAVRWDHISREHGGRESGRLELPDTKTGRRTHDLPGAALAILDAMPRINSWVFTTGSPSPVVYKTVRKHFNEAVNAAGLVDVRLHDLRRSFMTNAAAAGVGTHILRDLLGHKTTAMADRYVRAVGEPVREARERIAASVDAAMNPSEKVVAIRAKRRRG